MSLIVRPIVGRRAKISALGTYVPPDVITNKDLEKLVETNDQWIVTARASANGISWRGPGHERYVRGGGEEVSGGARN